MNEPLTIIADYREVQSAIPEMLKNKGANVELANLEVGDYLLNNQLIIERKTRIDFIHSIIDNRLFNQCNRIKHQSKPGAILIEGNPYQTNTNISRNAIKGALLSIALSWQLPVIFTKDKLDTAETLIMSAQQTAPIGTLGLIRANKPKRIKSRTLFFLQGLPLVGSKTAESLIKHFHTLENIILASEEKLLEVDGLGKEKAKTIRKFLSSKHF